MNELSNESLSALLRSTDKPVLVDFWATWCGPCRLQGPILDEFARENESQVVVAKVNVEQHKELAAQFNIFSIPTLILFKDGKECDRLLGLHTKEQLNKAVSSLTCEETR